MTTFAPALHLQNDNIHTKIKAQMIIKDPGSSITHFIGMLCAIAGLFPLILKAASYGTTVSVVSMTVFMVSMILLYAASTTYHTFDISSNVNIVLKRLDHCMIPVLIAGSYTPVCLIVLHNIYGYVMFGIVWGIAILAIAFKLLWVTCNGLDMCYGSSSDIFSTCRSRFLLASRRRNLLHCWRRNICS